jgi:hypothetical protein
MDRLLFTFNSQQLSQDIRTIAYHDQPQSEGNIVYQSKKDNHLRSLRTKKMMRYEQYIENVQLEDPAFKFKDQRRNLELSSICLDDDPSSLVRPHSKKTEAALRPRVLSKNKQFPLDFNLKSIEKPRSLQLISMEIQKDESPMKKRIREEL